MPGDASSQRAGHATGRCGRRSYGVRWRRAAIVVGACGVLAGFAACDRLPTSPHRSAQASRGITLASWSADGYATPAARAAIADIASTGATTVVFVVTAYQSDARDALVRVDAARTPTRAAVREAVEAAYALGLDVAIKPHVDLDDGAWRGTIEPRDVAAWFDSYRDFLVEWAEFADSVRATEFVVGTELAGTVTEAEHWRALIEDVRSNYRGTLIYAASWDEAERVTFWRDVDVAGIDFYFPVTRRSDAGRLEIIAGWQPWLARLQRLKRQIGRPLRLTELGYCSVDGAGMHPYRCDGDAALDLDEQADLYVAALEAVRGAPWIDGLWWWNWLADGSGGPLNRDYTPAGKPAAEALKSAWRASP